MQGKVPGDVCDDNGLKIKFVWCPPGVVTMEQVEQIEEPATNDDETDNDDPNDNDAGKTHFVEKITPVKVFLSHGYWLGKYEVTQSEWKQAMVTEPWKGKPLTREGADFPATFVSWVDAVEFCHRLTEREHKAGRVPDGWEYTLPTEAQWDRACRARTETMFSFGDDESNLSEYAWFDGNAENAGEKNAHRVGQKKPNPWGLHDMHGNVMEWCRDMLAVKLPGGRDPEVTKEGVFLYRVSQGGYWGGAAWRCRSANHTGSDPSSRSSDLGFRVALPRKWGSWNCFTLTTSLRGLRYEPSTLFAIGQRSKRFR